MTHFCSVGQFKGSPWQVSRGQFYYSTSKTGELRAGKNFYYTWCQIQSVDIQHMSTFKMAALCGLKVTDLKELLKEKGVPSTGSKAKLICGLKGVEIEEGEVEISDTNTVE